MPCPRLRECELKRSVASDVALLRWQEDYCHTSAEFQECHCFRLAQGGQPVPPGMLPNGFVLP